MTLLYICNFRNDSPVDVHVRKAIIGRNNECHHPVPEHLYFIGCTSHSMWDRDFNPKAAPSVGREDKENPKARLPHFYSLYD